MAESPSQVLEFLSDLAARVKPFALRDYDALSAFAREQLGLEKLAAWDIGWASEKLRVERYAFSEQEVKQYFPEAKVLSGLFRLVETLYGIRITPGEASSGIPTCASSISATGRASSSGSSMQICLRGRPSAAVPGWTTP